MKIFRLCLIVLCTCVIQTAIAQTPDPITPPSAPDPVLAPDPVAAPSAPEPPAVEEIEIRLREAQKRMEEAVRDVTRYSTQI